MFDWVKKDLKEFGNYINSEQEINELGSTDIDIAFIGSGLSSTYTLIEFIKQLDNKDNFSSSSNNDSLIRIVMFEKDSWLWGGIPYGRRSGFTSLIITPLDEFLPESELQIFIKWMSENINWLIVPFKENAGSRSMKWLEESEEKIITGQSANLHIPRYFFGIYIWDKLKESINNSKKNIKLDFVNSEIISIETLASHRNNQNGFEIQLDNNNLITSKQVLLGVGIPKIRSLIKSNKVGDDILLLNDPYFPDLDSSLDSLERHITKNKSSKILIVGANASALELIYQITNKNNLEDKEFNITVISPQGKLPDLFIKDKDTEFCAEELEKLYSSKDEITADIILNSLEKDLDFANKNNFEISDTLPIFTNHVGTLIKKLSKKEKFKFISYHGVEIGRLQRRAGLEYTQPVKELLNSKKLKLIKGKFLNLSVNKGKTFVNFVNDLNTPKKDFFDVVINCAGSSGLSKDGMTPLLKQLKDSGLCKPTVSNHGFKVGDKFEVKKGFYINGPLLAGNVVGDMGIWHVEHCGRIISFSKQIAENIIDEKVFDENR